LSIQQNQALFALLGVQFGGDGRTNFKLPNLQGCSPVSWGQSTVGTTYTEGDSGGNSAVTMTVQQLPNHQHSMMATNITASSADPAGGIWAGAVDATGNPLLAYTSSKPDVAMDTSAVGTAGSGAPIPMMQPSLVVNYIIALNGIWPSRG
jgi:microcystin-dependent protein